VKKRIWIGIIIVILLAIAGGGYFAYTRYSSQTDTTQEQVLQTGTVSQGDLVITADGTGNLLPAVEAALAFKVNGTVTEVNVEIGDKVNQGDVLVKLDTTELYTTLQEATYQLEQARLDLQKAQRDAEAGTSVELAKKSVEIARLALVNAQGSYAATLLSSNVSSDVSEAKAWADFWQSDLGDKWLRLQDSPNSEKRLLEYEVAGSKAEAATNNWKQIELNAQNQKTSAWRNVLSAQQSYLSALSNYTDTISGDPVRAAELVVLQNEIKVTQAEIDLQSATLTAPMTGTVTEVTAVVGQNAGTSAVVTLIDLDHPMVRFWVEEADMGKVVVGNKVNVTFEALPDETFSGEIIRVEPVLVSVGNTTAVQAWASLDNTLGATLLSGMTADVEVISAEARDVLLVPVQALRELAPGQYAVFVVPARVAAGGKPDGKLEMRPVQVGLRDLVNVEILSGLQAGETISLGTQSRSTQSAQPYNQAVPLGGGGMGRFFGGD